MSLAKHCACLTTFLGDDTRSPNYRNYLKILLQTSAIIAASLGSAQAQTAAPETIETPATQTVDAGTLKPGLE